MLQSIACAPVPTLSVAAEMRSGLCCRPPKLSVASSPASRRSPCWHSRRRSSGVMQATKDCVVWWPRLIPKLLRSTVRNNGADQRTNDGWGLGSLRTECSWSADVSLQVCHSVAQAGSACAPGNEDSLPHGAPRKESRSMGGQEGQAVRLVDPSRVDGAACTRTRPQGEQRERTATHSRHRPPWCSNRPERDIVSP